MRVAGDEVFAEGDEGEDERFVVVLGQRLRRSLMSAATSCSSREGVLCCKRGALLRAPARSRSCVGIEPRGSMGFRSFLALFRAFVTLLFAEMDRGNDLFP